MAIPALLVLLLTSSVTGPAHPPVRLEPVTIRFRAVVAGQDFACGASYDSLGSTRSRITPTDLRMYVHDLQLVDAAGRAVSVALAPDSIWQTKDVALLDFENGESPCSNGTAATHLAVAGLVPAGRYHGLRFTIGIPMALNHRDPVKQPSPLNITSMFWVWRSGYKFLRFDFQTSGPEGQMFLHLGSTGCTGVDSLRTSPASHCARPNRATVELPAFNPASDEVVLDLGELLAGSDLDHNQPKTAKGCMSAPDDTDCAAIFDRLGLGFGDRSSTGQRVFSARPRALP